MCANFMIVEGMELNFHQGSDKMLFVAVPADYSEPDEDPKAEAFLIKFKNKEIAGEFKAVFDAQLKSSSSPVEAASSADASKKESAGEPKSLASLDQFKPKAGSWECDVCLVRNGGEANKCVACETPRPGCEPEKKAEEKPKFSFGFNPPASSVPRAPAPAQPKAENTMTSFSFKPPTAPTFTFGSTPGGAAGGFSFNLDTSKPLFTFGSEKPENVAGVNGTAGETSVLSFR